ncbi:MAG: EAL domain-containing protein [Planctomycetes bacterium]|nr:EAL domain-containing protein [Planctomycetota bacterium]
MKKLLLVADDSQDRATLASILAAEFSVTVAASADEGLAALAGAHDFAGVVAALAPAAAPAFLDRAREHLQTRMAPLVAVIDRDDPAAENAAFAHGASEVFARPYHEQVALRRVSGAVNGTSAGRAQVARIEEMLNETALRLSTLLDSIPGGILIFHCRDLIHVSYFNDALPAMLGYSRDDFARLLEGGLDKSVHPQDCQPLRAQLQGLLAQDVPGSQTSRDFRFIDGRGGWRWLKCNATYVGRQNGHQVFYAVLLDINKEKLLDDERRLAAQQLQYRNDHDHVTGIYNREAFFDRTMKMLSEHPDADYVLICWNIERLKVINDVFGTRAGDKVLRRIGRDLQENVINGTYGRLGGDRFAICCPKAEFSEERLSQKIQEGFGTEYPITCNFGVYLIDRSQRVPIEKMCDRAELAAQTVKGNAITHYAIYDDDLRDELVKVQEIVGNMQLALDSGDFVIHLQPIYSLSARRPVGAEALVRWNRLDKGLLAPVEFIPLFEQNGFIVKLDFYVWERICRYLREAIDAGAKPLPVSVNVSRGSLYYPGIADALTALLARHGLEPSCLRLEIAERAFTNDPAKMLDVVRDLRAHHFAILLDGYGSGHSSLNLLKDDYFDVLKLDMRVLRDSTVDDRAERILRLVAQMAEILKLKIIAEGVERPEELTLLREIGCDEIQGFLFSPPMPLAEFSRLREQEIPV